VLGQELELSYSLDRLESTAKDLEDAVDTSPQGAGTEALPGTVRIIDPTWDELEREILRAALGHRRLL